MANNRYDNHRYGRSQDDRSYDRSYGRSSEEERDRTGFSSDYGYQQRSRQMDEGSSHYDRQNSYQSRDNDYEDQSYGNRGLYDPREAARDQNYLDRGIESDLNERTNREFSRDFNRENERGLMDDYNRNTNRNYRAGFSGHFDRDMGSDYNRSHDMRSRRDYNETLHAGKGPKGWQRSDDNIREQVCDSLERDNHIDASEIEVTVKEGIVTLSGKVDNRQTKRHAEDLIENLSGVKDVRNELSVDRSFFQQAKDFVTGRDSEQTSNQASKASNRPQTQRH